MVVVQFEPLFIFHDIPPYDIFSDNRTPRYPRIEEVVKKIEGGFNKVAIGGMYATLATIMTSIEVPYIISDVSDKTREQ